jgi:hypothetical protein
VSVTMKVGRRRIARPAAGIKRSWGALTPRDRFDCPHWVPQRAGRDGRYRARDRQPSPHVPPKRRKPAADQAFLGAVICRVLPPNACWRMIAKPTIHRREKVPAAVRRQDFRSPPQDQAQPAQVPVACYYGR